MKQWMINCMLFIICLTALGFSLMKITPFEIYNPQNEMFSHFGTKR